MVNIHNIDESKVEAYDIARHGIIVVDQWIGDKADAELLAEILAVMLYSQRGGGVRTAREVLDISRSKLMTVQPKKELKLEKFPYPERLPVGYRDIKTALESRRNPRVESATVANIHVREDIMKGYNICCGETVIDWWLGTREEAEFLAQIFRERELRLGPKDKHIKPLGALQRPWPVNYRAVRRALMNRRRTKVDTERLVKHLLRMKELEEKLEEFWSKRPLSILINREEQEYIEGIQDSLYKQRDNTWEKIWSLSFGMSFSLMIDLTSGHHKHLAKLMHGDEASG